MDKNFKVQLNTTNEEKMSVVHGDGVKAEEPAGIRREGGGVLVDPGILVSAG